MPKRGGARPEHHHQRRPGVPPVPAWHRRRSRSWPTQCRRDPGRSRGRARRRQIAWRSARCDAVADLALRKQAPDDAPVQAVFAEALAALIAQGDAHWRNRTRTRWRCVARTNSARSRAPLPPTIRQSAPSWHGWIVPTKRRQPNRLGERELNAGRLGETAKAARSRLFREALRLRPATMRGRRRAWPRSRAQLIRRAEAGRSETTTTRPSAGSSSHPQVRPGFATSDDARARIARGASCPRRRPARSRPGSAAPRRRHARGAPHCWRSCCASPNPATRPRPNCASASTWPRITACSVPGQVFTDAIDAAAARGPQMVVVPHGGVPHGRRRG